MSRLLIIQPRMAGKTSAALARKKIKEALGFKFNCFRCGTTYGPEDLRCPAPNCRAYEAIEVKP